KNELLRGTQSGNAPVAHDRLDALLQIRPCHSGNTDERRFRIKPANPENRFGVSIWQIAAADYVFVAGAFALLQEPGADPPHKRMEPEQCFDDYVDRRPQIVAPPHVAQFVRKDGVHFRVREAVRDAARQKQYGASYAYNSWLEEARREANFNRRGDV